jgi:CRP-like cAMP-binding protein
MSSVTTLLPENRLLAALPPTDRGRLLARTTLVTLGHKDLLYRAGGPIDYVYFPRSGAISSVIVMEDGQVAETTSVGRDGMIGVAACVGAATSPEQVFVQVAPSECRKMAVVDFADELARCAPFREVIHAYFRGYLAATAQQTACNGLHSVEERCARWLLESHDQVGADEFPLTHEFLATMLGVRRATVTVTAGLLQSAGLITYRHGRVTILDRKGLEHASCECYRIIRSALEIQ